MGKMSSKESAIPWGWALEALVSSEEVAVSVLHDLIEKVVPHLPDDLRNSVNERVALRCLDDLFGPHDAPPAQRSKLSLDFSESCQAVLKRIVNEVNTPIRNHFWLINYYLYHNWNWNWNYNCNYRFQF